MKFESAKNSPKYLGVSVQENWTKRLNANRRKAGNLAASPSLVFKTRPIRLERETLESVLKAAGRTSNESLIPNEQPDSSGSLNK
jgi:hypothetical protein